MALLVELHPGFHSCASFNIIGPLGGGTFGQVFRVGSKITQDQAALKKIIKNNDQISQDCVREVELLYELRHSSNIIKLYASFMDGNELNIVLELAEGDLNRLIDNVKFDDAYIPEILIWKYFGHVSNGLSHMHSLQIIHLDIKPANVLFTRSQNGEIVAKLGDLGLGRFVPMKAISHSKIGTPYYMPPEMVQGDYTNMEISYDYKCDIWSLGCVLYEMAALKSPFSDAKDEPELYFKIKGCDYPVLPARISNEVQNLVKKCIQSKADKRPIAENVQFAAECAYAQLYADFTNRYLIHGFESMHFKKLDSISVEEQKRLSRVAVDVVMDSASPRKIRQSNCVDMLSA